ncbi:MAG: Crp/Fnr family transcriptional regulator [Nitrospirae bacterium]|nr:Crp/Fnr family transcriptional regulator [Nitrospirota bacterium]
MLSNVNKGNELQCVADVVKSVKLFSHLTEEEFRDILKVIKIRTFTKDSIIICCEDTNECLHIVLNGEVRISRSTKDGMDIIVAIGQPGDYFGEMSLIDGHAASATVTATKNSLIASIFKSDFHNLICADRIILDNLLRTLCARLRSATETIEMLNYNTAPKRLEMCFKSLANTCGDIDNGGITLKIKLTHQDIADMTGMTRPTVTKVLDDWKRFGYITILQDKKIRLSAEFIKNICSVSI